MSTSPSRRPIGSALAAVCFAALAGPTLADAQAPPPNPQAQPSDKAPPDKTLPPRPVPQDPVPESGNKESPIIKPPPNVDPGMAKPAPIPNADNTPIIKPPPNAENPAIPK
jgi:hypothetical protein